MSVISHYRVVVVFGNCHNLFFLLRGTSSQAVGKEHSVALDCTVVSHSVSPPSSSAQFLKRTQRMCARRPNSFLHTFSLCAATWYFWGGIRRHLLNVVVTVCVQGVPDVGCFEVPGRVLLNNGGTRKEVMRGSKSF